MGDPRKTRKKYSTPRHPWEKARIENETELTKKYAFKNKKEIWKMTSTLSSIKDQAKKLSTLTTKQAEKEKELLLKKLISIGMMKEGDKIEQILTLGIENFLERRLQTITFNKGLARSIKQARQFITHGHIMINDKVITSPSHIVRISDEGNVKFRDTSAISDLEHPERVTVVKEKTENKNGKE